jgi:alkanesulfonate monooxygenase SsuD/methylene tetrahydromethanopterin reductase-like flavin-dependent oxidoreductase (luciferase family)
VIFIFLFVVMIGYALTAQKAEEAAAARVKTAEAEALEAGKEAAEAAEALKAAEEALAEAGQDLKEQRALAAAYEDRVRDYEGQVIGERVKIVTISGSYDGDDSKIREMLVMLNGESPVSFSVTPDTQDRAFERIRRMVREYIEMFDESDRTVVVISVNSTGIQRRDRQRLDVMIDEFTTEYSFVY